VSAFVLQPKEKDPLVLKLLELCPFVPIPVIKLALSKNNRKVDKSGLS
jgi:hypothetical protein